jgi:hypothetical protein
MKMRATAKQTERRDQCLDRVIAKFFPTLVHLKRIEWGEQDGTTIIDVECDELIVGKDKTIVKRLAAALKLCGCKVKVLL